MEIASRLCTRDKLGVIEYADQWSDSKAFV